MPEQDFILPTIDGSAFNIMYGSSVYLWILFLLFIMATLVIIYFILGARIRSVKKARSAEEKAEDKEGESAQS